MGSQQNDEENSGRASVEPIWNNLSVKRRNKKNRGEKRTIMDYNTILKIHEFIVTPKKKGGIRNKTLLYRKISANKCRIPTELRNSGRDSQWMLSHRVNDCWERGYHPRCAKHRHTGNSQQRGKRGGEKSRRHLRRVSQAGIAGGSVTTVQLPCCASDAVSCDGCCKNMYL